MPERDAYPFGAIAPVAMQNGIGNGFGKADEDVAMNVRRKVVTLGYRVDKRLNFGDVVGV